MTGTIHPYRGEWIEFDVEQKPGKDFTAGTRVARKRRLSIFVLLRALGYDEETRSGLPRPLRAPLRLPRGPVREGPAPRPDDQDEALVEIYKRARPGEPPTVESARAYFRNAFFENRRYDLAASRSVQAEPQARQRGAEAPRAVRPRSTPSWTTPDPDQDVLSRCEVLAACSYLLHLAKQEPGYRLDDQDHFANRRIRSVGELIQNQVRIGLSAWSASSASA